ncbi:hypothetical protein CWB73_18705 [Pseudoalteromonas phenolica]|uniref:Uncharacterized protein n=2 Tax=Pseudoalteromonas phenolica TaxID=161398 RepID=A0A5S3YNG6_9GAMM|nr:hypothetical protein [Pseudoalteromonas phenolica]TMN90120.1 hypothetical protein CWB72_09340 [Pseudoalteromonas phenolica]TMP77846.1 hypothetical protein CWB73_18705 [Pseudoalteromonas phenolica]
MNMKKSLIGMGLVAITTTVLSVSVNASVWGMSVYCWEDSNRTQLIWSIYKPQPNYDYRVAMEQCDAQGGYLELRL